MKKFYHILQKNGEITEIILDDLQGRVSDEIDREEITESDFKLKKHPKRLLDKAKQITGH